MHPEVELVPLQAIASRTYVGVDGIRRFALDAAATWDVLRFAVHRLAVAGERAVLLGRYQAVREGALRDGRIAWVLEIDEGLVRRSTAYGEWGIALGKAGLTLADARPLAEARL